MNPFLIRLTYTGIIVTLTAFLTYQWATANAEKKQAEAVTQAVTALQQEINDQYKLLDKAVTDYNREALQNEEREQKDQRRLRQLQRQLAKNNNDLDTSRNLNVVFLDAFRLLDNATTNSNLPDSDYPAGFDNAYETTTEFELISYTRAIIARYESEGLRANKLREVITDLPCVN